MANPRYYDSDKSNPASNPNNQKIDEQDQSGPSGRVKDPEHDKRLAENRTDEDKANDHRLKENRTDEDIQHDNRLKQNAGEDSTGNEIEEDEEETDPANQKDNNDRPTRKR